MYETQAVETPQLDRQDSHRMTSRSKPPFFWKKVTIFLGLGKFVRQSDASKHSNMLKQFDELKALDNDTRQKLRSEVITYQKQLATLNILIKGGQTISRWLLLLMLVLIWITAFRVAP